MSSNSIYSDEYINIFEKTGEVFIEVFKSGFPFNKLYGILSAHPEIGVTSFTTLKSAINSASNKQYKFGELKEKIDIELLPDNLKATVIFNAPAEELHMDNRKKLIELTMLALKEKDIVFGIKTELFEQKIVGGKEYIIAEGISPVDGSDSIIKMYELKDTKPEIKEDGKADFYELKLINKVKIGDWLGERIEATDGIPGKSVKGEVLNAKSGKNYPLNYDKNSVQEIFDNTKTVLYSRINGAVNYDNGRIGVSNHLEIDGDIDLSTGNIKFDGYLSIKGTVSNGFRVEATKDIEINSEIGLGNVKGIISTDGSIYIKGGIASKDKVIITAKKNVYTKFCDNCVITCGGSAHIGYYSINSVINAREVIFDSSKGQVIGGIIKADYRVQVPIAGSEIEIKTDIDVTGFNRLSLIEEFDNILCKIDNLKKQQQELKRKLIQLEDLGELNRFQRKECTNVLEKLFETNEQMKNTEEEKRIIKGLLKTRGEGEISITKKSYPNTTLVIKNRTLRITSPTLSSCYFIQDGELRSV